MHVTAILRTLVVALGLLVLSPWQAAEVEPTATARATAATCLTSACEPAAPQVVHVDRIRSPGLAVLVPSSDDASQDDACVPPPPHDGRPAESRALSRGEPRPVRVARAQPDGPERPPKTGSYLPT